MGVGGINVRRISLACAKHHTRAVKRRVRLCVRVTGRRVDNLAGMEVVIDGIRESLLESVRTGWEGMREVGGGARDVH